MGEVQGTLFSPDFNHSVVNEARPERLSSDAGALLIRDLTDRLGLPDQNDVALLRHDPVLRLAVSTRKGDSPLRPSDGPVPDQLCSQSTLSRLLYVLTGEENKAGLARIVRQLVVPFLGSRRQEATLDLDSFPHMVHGHQPGTAYNAHYHARCFHPLVASIDGRFFLGGRLRADAGFPAPSFLDALEHEDFPYVCRLRTNPALERLAAPFLTRLPGRPPAEGRTWFHELSYRAATWSRARRVVLVVLVVLERPDEQQHLFLDHFFLLTSAPSHEESPEALLDRYRQRGTAESDFGAFKATLHATLSSAPRPKAHYRERPVSGAYHEPDTFAANQAKLLLALLAANILAAGADLLSRDDKVRMSRERFRAALLEIPPARGSPLLQALPIPA